MSFMQCNQRNFIDLTKCAYSDTLGMFFKSIEYFNSLFSSIFRNCGGFNKQIVLYLIFVNCKLFSER